MKGNPVYTQIREFIDRESANLAKEHRNQPIKFSKEQGHLNKIMMRFARFVKEKEHTHE